MIERLESLINPSEFEAFSNSLTARPPKSIRPRIDRAAQKIPFETKPIAWYPRGLEVLDPSIRPGGFLEYAAADYYIQDAGSMLPLSMLEIHPDDWICDLCAAPGGKATAIAEMLGTNGFLLANEVIAGRLDVLRFALARTGRANYAVSNIDPEPLAERLAGRFDKVLVDVPCSGQSLLGRKRQSESSFAPSHVQHCAARAKRILANALRLVRPGGRLILSTCTFAIEENEAQIECILKNHSNAVELLNFPELAEWQSPILPGCYRLWPHRDHCAGGFAAAIKVLDEIQPEQALQPPAQPSRKSLKRRSDKPNKPIVKSNDSSKEIASLGNWMLNIKQDGSLWLGCEPGAEQFEREIGNPLYQALRIGQVQRDRIEPYHSLAMLSPNLFEPARFLELDPSNAQRYMLGQSIDRSSTDEPLHGATTPWTVARWNGKPLGWLKHAGNRYNNYLPTWARFTSFTINSDADDSQLE